MMNDRSLWLDASPTRGICEAVGIGLAVLYSLFLLVDHVPGSVLGNGLLGLCCMAGMWAVLRIRFSAGPWLHQVLWEARVGAALGAAMAVGLIGPPTMMGWDSVWSRSSLRSLLPFTMPLLGIGPGYLLTRGGVRLLLAWRCLRRRRMLWGLTHANLTVLAVVGGLVALVALVARPLRYAWTDTVAGETPGLRHDLEVVEEEVLRLQRLIDDLFTLSRAEVRSLNMALGPVYVDRIIRRRVEALAPLAWSRQRVEIVADLPDGLPRVRADEGRLDQVLANLLRNALRHTDPGGIVVVAAEAQERTVRIEVRDTGEGIPPDELDHVWERFYRGERGCAREVEGTGLGLALVKQLTEAMGGEVAVESEPGKGSIFTVWLPGSGLEDES